MTPAELWRRVVFLVRRHRMAEELEEEMRLHTELRARQLREQGLADADAAARRRFGNRTLLAETSRETWAFLSLETLWRELKFAARTLRNSPGFTATALLTLALGIGANTAVFSVVDAVLLKPLPYPQPDRLGQVVMSYKTATDQGLFDDVDGRLWELLRDHADALDFAVFSDMTTQANFAASGRVGYLRQQRVSAGYFRVLGMAPALGREFTRTEDTPGGPSVAVLSYGAWEKVFHGDRAILDRPLLLRGQPYTIVGVMSAALRTDSNAEVWTPLRPSTTGEGANNNYNVIGRVRPGATWEKARTQVETLGAERLRDEHDIPPGYKVSIVIRPLQEMLSADLRTPVLLLWCAVAVVLVIGCTNIAGLLIARGGARRREIGTRIALGGGRAQVIHQLLTESLLLAGAAGVVGLVVGYGGIAGLRLIARESLGLWQAIALDWRVLLATAAVTLLTSILFGLWPAFQASRVDIQSALAAAGGRGVAGMRTLWPRRLLVAAEMALGVMLLVAAGLMVRSFLYLRNQPLSFNPANVVAARLPLQDARYQTSDGINRLFEETLSRIRELPGVESAAVTMTMPWERGLNTMARAPGAQRQDTVLTFVTPEYFHVLQTPILQGRALNAHDNLKSALVAIVNATFAQRFFAGANPVGRTVTQNGTKWRIVGLTPDLPTKGSLTGYAPAGSVPMMFIPAAQCPDDLFQLVNVWFTPSFLVRSPAPMREITSGMQRAIASVDPLLPFSEFHSIGDLRSETLARERFEALVMSMMAALALLLAAVGTGGLIAQTVVERTREVGIRLALGATVRQAVGSVAVPGMVLALAGAAVGVAVSLATVGLLRHMIWGIRTTDVKTFAATTSALVVVAAAATLIPALRIVRLNVAETLRNE